MNFIGGYSALVQKGFAPGDEALIRSIPQALAETDHVCSSVNIGSTKAGINLDACKLMGEVVRQTAEATQDRNCHRRRQAGGVLQRPGGQPLYGGSFPRGGGSGLHYQRRGFGPGVVRAALAKAKGASISEVADIIKKTAFKITRMGQLVGTVAGKRLGVPFGIVDLSLAPTPAVGDSVAHILEEIGLEQCGTHAPPAALALLNDAVKKGGVMASSRVGGLSGAFIPVTEDAGMIDAARSGIPAAGEAGSYDGGVQRRAGHDCHSRRHPATTISAIIADEAAIGMVNSKTTAVRVIPAIGVKAGEELTSGDCWIRPGDGNQPQVGGRFYQSGRADSCTYAEFEELKFRSSLFKGWRVQGRALQRILKRLKGS